MHLPNAATVFYRQIKSLRPYPIKRNRRKISLPVVSRMCDAGGNGGAGDRICTSPDVIGMHRSNMGPASASTQVDRTKNREPGTTTSYVDLWSPAPPRPLGSGSAANGTPGLQGGRMSDSGWNERWAVCRPTDKPNDPPIKYNNSSSIITIKNTYKS